MRVIGIGRVSVVLAFALSSGGFEHARGTVMQSQARVEGTVTDSAGGRPIAMAEVILAGGDEDPLYGVSSIRTGGRMPATPRRTTTDTGGRFIFDQVESGLYRLGVSAIGYVPMEHGQVLPYRPGDAIALGPGSRETVALRLRRLASLTGRIADSDNEPVPGLTVYLMSPVYDVGGNRQLFPARDGVTDASGGYEIQDVLPGRYLILAGARSNMAGSRTPPDGGAYGFTYYPGVTDETMAVPIDILPGMQLANMNVVVAQRPLWTVRGRIWDARTGMPPGAASVRLHVASPLRDDFRSVAYDVETGEFEVEGLLDGQYAIAAEMLVEGQDGETERDGWSWTALEVNGSDVDAVEIILPQPRLRGTVSLSDGHALSEAFDASFPIVLEPIDRFLPTPGRIIVEPATGEFRVPNAISGRYRVLGSGFAFRGIPDDYYVRDIFLNGSPTSDRVVDVTGAQELRIVLAANPARVEGVVVDSDDRPLSGLSGLLIPQPLRREVGFYRLFFTESDGRFSLTGIPPGRYTLLAFQGLELIGMVPGPEVLRRLASASQSTSVVLTAGGTASVVVEAAVLE